MEGLEHFQSNSHGYYGISLEELVHSYNSIINIEDDEC